MQVQYWEDNQTLKEEVSRFLKWQEYKVRMAKLWAKENKEWDDILKTLDKVL